MQLSKQEQKEFQEIACQGVVIPICVLTIIFLIPNSFGMLALHWPNWHWWELITSSFVHTDLNHISGNVLYFIIVTMYELMLFTFSRKIKKFRSALLSLFITTPIITAASTIASFLISGHSFQNSGGFSSIASAVFGMLPVAVFVGFNSLNKLSGKDRTGIIILLIISTLLCIMSPYLLVFGAKATASGTPNITAHVTGYITGFITASFLFRKD